MTMLRCRRVTIEKLEMATMEVAAHIEENKLPLLEEIYRVAKMEERYVLGTLRKYPYLYGKPTQLTPQQLSMQLVMSPIQTTVFPIRNLLLPNPQHHRQRMRRDLQRLAVVQNLMKPLKIISWICKDAVRLGVVPRK